MTAGRWLAVCALVYGTLHHQGTALDALGETGLHDTRWADWLDIATPYAVLLPVAAALHSLAADRASWWLYLVGAITYVEGHGVHLSANSIGNTEPPGGSDWPPIVHLWDEAIGHHLWIGGVVLVGLVGGAALTVAGWTDRQGFGRLVVVAFGGALVLLAAYGVWQGGFPEFTELGWA